MKFFKRIFTFSVMMILGVLVLASCTLTGEAKKVKIDMLARVYVSQTYELVAKDENGEILTDVNWSVSSGKEFAVIEDGKLVPVKAGVFELTVSNGKDTDTKKISAVNPISWDIEYNLNGGEESEDLFTSYNEFEEGKALVAPARKGYTFAGWYENEEFEGEAVTVVNGTSNGRNIELFAKWELNVYSVEFDLAGGVALELPESYSVENPVAELPEASKEHYTFLGWFTEEGVKVEDLGVEVVGVAKLVAHFEAIDYEISYELNGGSVEGNPATYTVEDEVELVAPTKLGYKFVGWELNGALVSKIEKGTSGALSFVAKWEVVVYALEFDLAGGACENLPASYSIEAPIASLPEAAKEHYTFLGWYDGETKVEALGAENLGVAKLVAKYAPVAYEISYELNGGSVEGNPVTYTIEDEVKLVAPTKLGYKFVGWELNGEVVEVIAKGTSGALTLVAKWEVAVYALEFDLAGGACENLPASYSIEAPIASLPEAAKEHYTFLGWYDGETKVEALGAENLGVAKLVAKYAPVAYEIAYELNGGSVEGNPVTYTIEDEVKLVAPTKLGYVFLGWELNGEVVEVIAKGTTGNLQLVATWKELAYTVKFDYNDGSDYGTILTIDEFAEELVKLFNSTGASDAKVTTREDFKATSHPNIKYVWSNAENLAAYKWFFEFAIEELQAQAEISKPADMSYLNSTVEMLEKMIAGDTTAVGGNYADARTIFRFWIEGLINKKLPKTDTSYYQNLMVDYSTEAAQQRFADAQGGDMPSEELLFGAQLPTPTREHYVFLGWFIGENKVETVTGNMTVVAQWELAKYEIVLDFNGGLLEGCDLETFTKDLLDMFNRDGGSSTLTTAENFKGTSHPQIKNVWSKAENLAAYKWFFEFALEEITIAATANGGLENEFYLNTKLMLEGMIAGDTNAVNINDGGNARTVFRWWIEGLLNQKLPTNTILYNDFMTDYSNAENMNKFLAKLAEPYTHFELTVNDKLPVIDREGYIFLGWYDGENRVEAITGNANLLAKWEVIKFSIDYDLNGGAWAEGQEPVTEFEWNEQVELLVPVKEGYTFLGWTQASAYVTEIGNENYKLTAKWRDDSQTGYEVIFDLNGGSFEKNLDQFAEELIKLFNSTGASDAKVTTREDFKATSHPNIKYVWSNAENLAAYKWFFEFAIEELQAQAEISKPADMSYLNSTVEMLEKMIAGDTTAVGGNYADARTIFRFWIEGLINNKLPKTDTSYYQNLMVDYSDPVNMARFVQEYCPVEATVEPNEELPVAVKENHFFLGWFVNGQKVEFATGNDVLVAGWIHEDDYEWTVEFDLNGGAWEGKTIDAFAAELVKLFNSTGASDAKVTTREDFKATSHPNIKYVWNKAENLAAYKWFFEFAIEELQAQAEISKPADMSYLNSTVEMLEKMIAGDTTAVGGNYADARTIFRFWIEGLINKKLPETDTSYYQNLMVDYSVVENQARFLNAYAVIDKTYTSKDVLPSPVKEGHLFLGWDHEGTIVESVKGNWSLVAQWLDLANTEYSISYDLAEGAWGEVEGSTTFKYNQFATLVEPVREGYKFVGWFEDGELVTAINENRDYNLVAEWESESQEEPKEVIVYVGEGKDYSSLNEAVSSVQEGTTIVIEAGEHELSAIISKSVKIVGPNAGLAALAPRNAEAVINVAKDVAGNLAAKEIVFDGVHLKGTGGGAGIPGVFFQDGGNIRNLTFKSCVISEMNTFVKFVNSNSNLDLLIEDCHIHTIGQFIVWTTGSINKTILIGNYIDGSTCGAVTNAAAALFRIRKGSLEAYNNTFNGDSYNLPGYFECSAEASKIMYNTFMGVSLFVHPTAKNNITFDQNLYLNYDGQPLSACPVTGGGNIVKDKKVASSKEEVETLFMNYLITVYPDRYFAVEFDAANGNMTSAAPSIYDTEEGIATLPTVEREGFIFLGWELNGKLVQSVPAGTKGQLTLVAKWREIALVVDGTTEEGHYATLADALKAAKDGDIIKLVAGEYLENVTINVPNLTIKGPNAGINGVNGTREAEAVVKGVWTLTSAAQGITIDGLSFTEGAKIAYGESKAFVGFVFQNNKVYDTTEYAMDWSKYETRYSLPGFIQFTLASGGSVQYVEILNNSFVNVSEINVLLNRSANVAVDGNLFKDFDVDAIRTEGGYVYGSLAFTNNVFEQTVAGNACQGIFLYSLAGASGSKTEVLVDSNKFINLGKDNGTVFTGALCAYRFQENLTTITIVNNIFDHCYDYIYLRNNGGNATNWFCTVENNQFLGLPVNQYFGTYRGADSESSNPHTAVFTKNYFEDNEGKVITNLSAYEQYFKHMASYGVALEAKPASSVAGRLEFWTISYDLNAGETKGTFIYSYNSMNKAPISLPKLEKPNHQFNGWLLNGVLVNEIPADARGNLHLVADFSVLEGEIYNITFENERTNAVWPSRAANDRLEIISELYKDLYEWAQGNGETKSYDEYIAWVEAELKAYNDIKLRNPKLGNYPAEDDSTEYFLNVPKYYQKWNEFFAVFNEAMIKVSAGQIFYTDTYAAMVRLWQFISWSSSGQSYFNSFLGRMCAATKVPQEIPTTYRGGQIVALPQLSMENGLEFLGWYDNPEFTGNPIYEISSLDSGDKVFYAKWAPEVKAEKVEINTINELLLFKTHQLEWTITPDNTTDKSVEFFSSDESVATISKKGLITGIAQGTTTITMKVYGNRELDVVFDLKVYVNDYIDGYYVSTSHVELGQTIQLYAYVVNKDESSSKVLWTSLNPEIATVDSEGVVTPVAAGNAKIVASSENNPELKLEFNVTVLDGEASDVFNFVVDNHESNVFTRYNLGIGSGVPSYYKDIFGSVSKLLMNHTYTVDDSRRDTEKNNATGDYFDTMTSVEFIAVHYTGNMAAGADAKANANYFVDKNSVSIHYTTGNDGIYQCLDHTTGGYHAGDSGAYSQVGAFKWIPTGVKAGQNDPLYPEFTISDDFYYEINGQKTSVPMPKPWNYSSRNTDHILNADGTISSKAGFGQTAFEGRTPESFINDQGLPFIVVDGEYYMGTTWWCYTQVYEGRICSTGGNRNSIGIESCVNEGSDLWLTWQYTAQLVARLMQEFNFDITRVRGHHFFSGKDCPQPMLENDLEIWWEFLSLVEAEYELLTKYSDYEIKFKSHNPEILDNNGRIVKQPDQTTCVSYTITITKDGVSESVTLSSIVKGLYVDR